ncbi:hypothetical protein [Kitasatospora sp. LaBMicrA B282]|uniref:hypothetical protein n=1 Tax=Kitasatospora sp. LaBMicrA B282 TaxID=3420949 RepID=UPI003D11EA09
MSPLLRRCADLAENARDRRPAAYAKKADGEARNADDYYSPLNAIVEYSCAAVPDPGVLDHD